MALSTVGVPGFRMIRSLAFTTQGRLHSRNIDPFLMPTLLSDTNLFLWLDLENPTPEETKMVLEDIFHFHPLSIEDCVMVSPSPKVEEYQPKEGDMFLPYLFMVFHAVDYSRKDGVFDTSELNFFIGRNFLVTFHERPIRAVSSVEERSVRGTIHIARAPDRVAHQVLDTIVDHYKPALEELSLEIAELEQAALQHPGKDTLNKIIQIKKEVMHLRQIIGLFHISTIAQNYMDSLTGILQVYLNMSSNQTGEVVKLLTLITVITTPLMIVGTWYGMNFKHMPELDYPHAYVLIAVSTVLFTVVTILYFRRRKWF